MSRIVDADEPIKTKHASKEYRDNWDRIFGDDHPVYYAHPVWLYNTPLERDDVERIARWTGESVLNPNAPDHEQAYQERKAATGRGMDYFLEDVLPDCHVCVLRADADGKVSSGAWLEAEWFLNHGLPVYEITDVDIVIFDFNKDRLLTVEESRARCGK